MSCCTPQSEAPINAAGRVRLTGTLVCLIIAGFVAGNSTLFAVVANLSRAETADANLRFAFQTGLLVATLLVAALLLPQLSRSVWINVQRRRLSVDALFVLGCVGAMWFSLRSYWAGEGPVYFEVVSILLFVYCLGSWVKGYTQSQIWKTLDAWSPQHHRCQRLIDDGSLVWVTVEEIQAGQRVHVPAGSMVPVDGTIDQGEAFLRTSTITGEPHVVPAKPGDLVLASSVVIDAPVVVMATVDGNHREIDRLTQSVVAAASRPSRWETQADLVAQFFTPVVALFASATFLGWWYFVGFDVALMNALAVLLVACPCAFGFATPVSIWVALSRLAGQSLLVRRNDVIDRMSAVDTVVFDKTGTLTIVTPTLHELHRAPGTKWNTDQIMQLACSLEAASHHPIATAFLNGAPQGNQEAASPPMRLLKVTQFEQLPATGVTGKVEWAGRMSSVEPPPTEPDSATNEAASVSTIDVVMGRFEKLRAAGSQGLVTLNDPWQPIERAAAKLGHQLIGIQLDGQLVAAAEIGERSIDTLEPGLERLRQNGLAIKVLSGDQGARLEKLGIADVMGGLTPDQKRIHCEQLRQQGKRILFVGDGTNDAAAMSIADASIATAAGSSLATEAADLVWYGNNLENVSAGIEVCQQSVQTLRQTLWFAITYNTLGMVVAAGGWLHPVFAVVLMLTSSLTVVLRASR